MAATALNARSPTHDTDWLKLLGDWQPQTLSETIEREREGSTTVMRLAPV